MHGLYGFALRIISGYFMLFAHESLKHSIFTYIYHESAQATAICLAFFCDKFAKVAWLLLQQPSLALSIANHSPRSDLVLPPPWFLLARILQCEAPQ